MTCGSGVLSRWASAGACGVRGGRVLCRRGPEAARSGGWEEVVRRGGVEGHAPDPPGAAQSWNSAHQSAGDMETRRRASASLGEMSCWVHLLSSLGLPASLSVLPIYHEKPGGKQPREVGGLLL